MSNEELMNLLRENDEFVCGSRIIFEQIQIDVKSITDNIARIDSQLSAIL